MIRVNQIRLPVAHTDAQLEQKIRKILKLHTEDSFSYKIVKQSVDARKKPELSYVYSVDICISNEKKIVKRVSDRNITLTKEQTYSIPHITSGRAFLRPVIAGAGPAGLFCAFALAEMGIAPIVLERGKCVEERTKDVERFWQTGVLDTASNVQFGEGGAGTFSDGKLNTLVKDPAGRNRFVLETFVRYGAPERILYENRPHIGTDILAEVIRAMRNDLEAKGVTFRFSTCMTDYRTKNGALCAVCLNHGEWLKTDTLILAIGHSARDTFRMLDEKQQLSMQAKAFAVGFRVEHPQMTVNFGQYGERYFQKMPAASYKVAAKLPGGRGVYSFCMCPGGYVVNASSEQQRLAVNGMSYGKRDGKNANSAIIVSVTPEDFEGTDALAGLRFQERLEERAYALGQGRIPQQLFGDYCANVPSACYGAFESQTKGAAVLCNLRGLLPEVLEQSFLDGMHQFAHEVHDFDRKDAILSAVESRTSSPVRIPRNERLMGEVAGIYPCGEGAGYAGGIMSAAMDGLKVAEAIYHERK